MNARTLREAGEVRGDEFLRRLLRDVDVLGQRERRLAVQHRVVDHLRQAAQLVLVHGVVHAKQLLPGSLVNVLSGAERLDERFLAGHVREHAQLDL